MNVRTENYLFDWRIGRIENHATEICRCTHLFDHLGNWDTALQRMSLRLSARALREAADRLEHIELELKGPGTAFPDAVDLRKLEAAE